MGASSSGGGGEYAKELELQRREAELKVREARLAEREKITGTFTPPNWPVCKPMVYHDIDKDIPAGGRWLVKRVYAGWWLAVIVYLANCIAAFSLLVTKVSTGGNMFGISLLILLVGTPVAFVFWYRPLYNGVRNGSSASFFVFWFNYGFHLGVAALLAVGIPGWGGVGVIITLQQFGKNVGVAVLCVIATVLMIFEVFYGLWQIKSANTYFKSSGMTTDSAKNEAAMTVLNSRAGREAVKTAAASELRRAI
ncbi:scamp family-domain-containing protein [Fimicolochytrium jonesii]|uniref:scamp family-domain-containing protein n=1 Tax=Fimicolochytrium jonesii TaxID=1396493 RepID=UPI0022FEAFEC|nr:scamp family-domain-containing protein [Fimicolochytrium jonesii]KAI8826960.1 scamp family-domain-containing protein [Fimicolochytrium jonesii]